MLAQPHLFPHLTFSCVAASPAPGTAFPDWPARPVRCAGSFSDAQRNFERRFLTDALRANRGNISRTARALGMSRRNLQIKIQKLGIDLDEIKGGKDGGSDDE